ncbi:hypothetical protein Q7C36_008657 [Tachysurus vachellii]|uniref:Taste receptor type 2 n=1 Tax=Tachysurus vachellii TaxID=175792 RepID=A0AA88N1R1_TACVA|nr:hypothetical protein Q7C36_008657 [Tachysurus vachellii]
MDSLTFVLLNSNISIFTFFVNIFLVFCMLFPQQGTDRLKQPLNVLLGTIVGCNITLQICIFLYIIIALCSSRLMVFVVAVEILFFSMRTSVTSSLWLNVFYYCQIVPTQHSVFIYLKRNIRFFIYTSLIAEKLFFIFGLCENIAANALFDKYFNTDNYTTQRHGTETELNTVTFLVMLDIWISCSYTLLCLIVMTTSSCATILYLRKHMKSMQGSSSTISSPRLQRQMRVTVTGIIQTVLFFLCSVWILMRELLVFVFKLYVDLNGHICFSVVCLYTFGSTVNLCVGQTIFRQRVVGIWQKFVKAAALLFK